MKYSVDASMETFKIKNIIVYIPVTSELKGHRIRNGQIRSKSIPFLLDKETRLQTTHKFENLDEMENFQEKCIFIKTD